MSKHPVSLEFSGHQYDEFNFNKHCINHGLIFNHLIKTKYSNPNARDALISELCKHFKLKTINDRQLIVNNGYKHVRYRTIAIVNKKIAVGLSYEVPITESALAWEINVTLSTSTATLRQELSDFITSHDGLSFTLDSGTDSAVPVNFTYFTDRVVTRTKEIICPTIDEIADNYDSGILNSIRQVANHPRMHDLGRIMFWIGKPGTGKTYMLRALMRAIKDRVSIYVAMDPEALLRNASYINDIMLDDDHMSDFAPGEHDYAKTRLIILEDIPNILLKHARQSQSYDMSRLLNISDGLIGQGSNIAFLFTTNEDVDSIDPAYLRPGRCLHKLNFELFSRDDAYDWLLRHNCDPMPKDLDDEVTLATLFAHLNDTQPTIQKTKRHSVGFL